MKTPHRVRTLVRLTPEQHDWLVGLGEEWASHAELQGFPEAKKYRRHDGEVNVSAVIRHLLLLGADRLSLPFPPD